MPTSQLTAPAATLRPAAAVVPGPGRGAVDLTLVLPLSGPAATLRYLIERLAEALYAQCISFELVAVADTDVAELSDLPLARTVHAARLDREASWQAGVSAAEGRWIGFLDVADCAELDAYGFIELLHQARESAVSA
ncbi:hypothetical protein ACWT_4674 [Actinoplanes sp. SE50]|uniref:hypothetical protein n=1 Tax=unclassified Actinoplanes TaxID=2626549 RepID=UPI00023EBBDB|nr:MULTISPECIES: hypothetical protein [unclassified Actinoplanes]AEV85696.1 hypothetical protein ACPL_4805 [Actinoplanes sp. SE50/110]ATO84089.1 hypothetical protein ACWT_4674 [Actinoplanes sp. SE50]SLM01499.1 hypothetical protein ACSP50_4735 [Actinoplanes sp. SE50/110]